MQSGSFEVMRHYAVSELGETGWAIILKQMGRSGQEYEAGKSYPDDEFAGLAVHVAQSMHQPLTFVLEGFGESMVPEMIRVYGFLINQRWSCMDFILNMQPLLESAFKLDAPGASVTPKIRVQRLGPDEISIIYDSNLRACGIVRGACRGAATNYGVAIEITDEKCVFRGDPVCVISVRSWLRDG